MTAAVIGPEGDTATLAAAHGCDVEALLDLLDQARAAHLLGRRRRGTVAVPSPADPRRRVRQRELGAIAAPSRPRRGGARSGPDRLSRRRSPTTRWQRCRCSTPTVRSLWPRAPASPRSRSTPTRKRLSGSHGALAAAPPDTSPAVAGRTAAAVRRGTPPHRRHRRGAPGVRERRRADRRSCAAGARRTRLRRPWRGSRHRLPNRRRRDGVAPRTGHRSAAVARLRDRGADSRPGWLPSCTSPTSLPALGNSRHRRSIVRVVSTTPERSGRRPRSFTTRSSSARPSSTSSSTSRPSCSSGPARQDRCLRC